jgi:hypothetical protein
MANLPTGIEQLAAQLLALERPRAESANGQTDHLLQVFEKIRAPLVKLAGSAGFKVLLARAVALASRRDASLLHLRVEIDGALSGLDEVRRASNGSHSKDHAWDHGGAIILAELLGLLVSFVGESLTLTLVREAWPDASKDPATDATATDSSSDSRREIP